MNGSSRSRMRMPSASTPGIVTGHPYPRSLRRRVEILKSAAAAFRARGYHATSVDDIAQALRMTKGNLYYYFKNKEEILYVCHDHTLDLLLRTLKDIQVSDQPPEAKLRAVVIAFVELMTEEFHGTAAVTLDLKELSLPLRQKITAKRDRFDRSVRRIIRDGIDQGVFRKIDPKFTTFAMMGGINWIPHWFNPNGKADAHAIGVAFADFFVAGLMARGAEARTTPGRRATTRRRRRSPAAQ
jgi:AcrR family transcriptional regulator